MADRVCGGGFLVDDQQKQGSRREKEEIVTDQVAGENGVIQNGDQFNVLLNLVSSD